MTQTRKLALLVGTFLGLTVLVSALTVPVFREAERESLILPATSQINVSAGHRG
jgi:hypothetical protein